LREQVSNTEVINKIERLPRLKKISGLAGKTAVCTATVCVVATPFVSYWANMMSDGIKPVRDQLENVGNQAGSLKESFEEGVPRLSEPLEGLNESLNPPVSNNTTTTSIPK